MNVPFRRGDGVAAWKRIADGLEGEIAAGRFRRGERLPTEAQLAAQHGVNRHTVRRALAALAERGLVRSSQGSGTFVEAPPLRYPIGPRTRFSEIATAAGREAWGRLLSVHEVAADPVLAEALELPPGSPILELDTLHEADGVPISTGLTRLPLPRFAGFAERYAETGSITRAYASYGVTDYLRRSTRITARPATPQEAEALGLAPGRVVLVLDSVNTDAQGRPIQATHARFAADRVELSA
ncbi:phosphonate metabolism transcriptional regulator PhnF [Roseomonas gilardii subsp. gilardii]|uniref:phosphonate metabolism transcriptional regulator PhnF n=1 Tax=Roseomonas gilardii TaxID=257708 RepID=UPI001FFB2A9E|nr:phosphonate metabolism transcriptional regulator PhnF [Roseomonas gilardii]UPG73385.1 phosphonate metabolism transcriptional regulator PhnF [Roseomonas gilardii subsp. gilardii]